jgi:enoyl-CoA hydratase/carnithine racemase
MQYEQILYAVEESILTITLARPERLNAFTARMCRELLDAFDRADADDSVRVVIVTGAGRAFCAGADLGSGADTFDSPAGGRAGSIAEHRDGGGLLTLRIYDSKKPVIAAINGPAVGVGVTMTLPMDVRIASSVARMGFVFVRRGIVPEAASSWFLPRVVGVSRAAEWVYTGRVFPAEEALAGGLVSRVVAPEDLLPTARALAREIADNTSAMSVALTRQMLWKMLGADHPMEAHQIDSKAVYWMGRSADAYEGVTAFLEKRPAKFEMKPSEMPEFYPWWEPRRWGRDEG